MFEEYQICPYTGLRSFTEEESLYFKGRDEHIEQATEQLQRNKFLMLTGASGDGKSSLVYAGIIPNARAGFLKSKHTQWCVADFRPERTPFKNLCRSVARQLDIGNPGIVESELQHGFSALVDLYRNSRRFVDTDSLAWQQADDAGKAALKREAANLIILVDQFEEFFTNPENYHRGVPSHDSNLVLNVLLETTRIALEEDLPVYVIFTMRSDYIGQCAAFRGLPEYIGFSQFFVPRLNRTQLQQVIEEPAMLSGNRITRRLTERLIHDITEGVDQLPILQHALNQIWHAANGGNEEMDLIHYAMVGGMPVGELPDEQVERFKQWFDSLPPEIKACYHEPDLQNVLDTHTNKLYEQASDYYKAKTGKEISDGDTKAIIKTAFTCLTKIDQSRAVRNRMTLKEISDIFGRHQFGTKEIGVVLNIFREPGNTFIRPFITDDQESQALKDDDVLDITHESLIRNWEYLGEWAEEEFKDFTVSLDFEQQLNRWVESGKSNGFLLSIGALTYFENWYNKVKPNAWWIARYLPEDIDQKNKLTKARQVLSNAQEFLKRSARKHVVTRTVMRYGPRRIAAVLGIIAVLMLSSFVVRDYFRRQNEYVLRSVKQETFEIANIPKLSLEFPVPVIAKQLILGSTTVPEVINSIKAPQQKIRIAIGIATQLVMQGRFEPKNEIFQSLGMADSLLDLLSIPLDNPDELSEDLKLINDYRVTAGLAYFYNPDGMIRTWVEKNAKRSAVWAIHVFQQQPERFGDILNLTLALENGINYKIFSESEIDRILKITSPFENPNGSLSSWVSKNFQRDRLLIRGSQDYGFKFNSLYQQLTYLYAAKGDSKSALQCVDSLLSYNQNYYQNDYGSMVDNATNIAAVFYLYGKDEALSDFAKGYSQRVKITPREFYYRTVSRTLLNHSASGVINFYAGGGGQSFSNLNLKFSDDSLVAFFFSKLKEETLKIKDADERNFNLAMVYKNEGAMQFYRKEIRGITAEGPAVYDHYEKAVQSYQTVSQEYLNRSSAVVGSSGADIISMPNKFQFLFPDFRVPFHPFEPRSFLFFYCSYSFVDYLLTHGLFDKLYVSDADLKYFELWLGDYHVHLSSRDWMMRDPMPYPIMEKLAAKMEERNAGALTDLNILYLHLGNTAFERGEQDKGILYLGKIQPDVLLNAFRYKGFNFVNSYSLEAVAVALANLAGSGQFDQALQLIKAFKKQVNRSSIYAFASQQLMLRNGSSEIAIRLLDSARVEMERIENPAVFQPNRHQVAIALMYIDPVNNSDRAYRTIKNSFNKFQAMTRFSMAHAFYGNLYEARQQMPELVSTADRTFFLDRLVKGYNLSLKPKPEWQKFNDNEFIFARRFLPYINEDD